MEDKTPESKLKVPTPTTQEDNQSNSSSESNLSESNISENNLSKSLEVTEEPTGMDKMQAKTLPQGGALEKVSISDIEELKISDRIKALQVISNIAKPYFIILVGLYIYNNNFWLGSLILTLGLLSLFNISAQDFLYFIELIKDLLGLSKK